MVDGPRKPFPRVAKETITFPRLLMIGAYVTTGRRRPTRGEAGCGTCTSSTVVPRVEVATPSSSTGARRARVPI